MLEIELPSADDLGLGDLDLKDLLLNISEHTFSNCSVNIAEDLFKPPPFTASHRLERTNEIAIRFGAPSDMMVLLSGTEDEQTSYVWGLLASSLFIAAFFLVWSIVICCFRYQGYRGAGFLCGRFVRPKPPEEAPSDDENDIVVDVDLAQAPESAVRTSDPKDGDAQEQEEKKQKEEKKQTSEGIMKTEGLQEGLVKTHGSEEYAEFCQRQDTRIFRTRVVVAGSAISVILNAILFCVYGTRYLSSSMTEAKDGLEKIRDLCDFALRVIAAFVSGERAVSEYNIEAIKAVNGFCPKVRDRMCEKLEPEVSNCDISDIPYVSDALEKIVDTVYLVKSYLFAEVFKLESDLQTLRDSVQSYLDSNAQLEWAYWLSFSFTLALGLLCLLILWYLYALHKGIEQGKVLSFYRRHLLWPNLIFFTLLAFAFSCSFVIAAIGASDWCIGSPDPKVSYLLEDNREYFESAVFHIAVYYINGCDSDLKPVQFATHLQILVNLLAKINGLAASLEGIAPDEWLEACGSEISVLDTFLGALERSTCLYGNTLEEINQLFWCRNWSPIYTTFMHEALCFDAQSGLAWVSSTMFCILFFGFIILLLRAAIFDVCDDEDFIVGVRRFRGGCNRLFCGALKKFAEAEP